MRVIFMGTPALAVPCLEAVHALGEVVQVICQPDRKSGRGMKLRPPPVKARALELGLPVEQPRKVRTPEFAASLRALEADVAVVIAYGRILPQGVLDAPRTGCLNVHASLLPRWRGAGPIQWAIAHGDAETGVCLMKMDEGMDTGPVIATARTPIGPDETAGELGPRLADLGADLLREHLAAWVAGERDLTPQPETGVTMAPLLTKEDGRLDFTQPAQAVHDRVRAMAPWPGAFVEVDGEPVKVHRSTVLETETVSASPGVVVAAGPDGVDVACGEGTVRLLELQRRGKRRLPAADFLTGRPWSAGKRLAPEPR